jgi:hypothetical protein
MNFVEFRERKLAWLAENGRIVSTMSIESHPGVCVQSECAAHYAGNRRACGEFARIVSKRSSGPADRGDRAGRRNQPGNARRRDCQIGLGSSHLVTRKLTAKPHCSGILLSSADSGSFSATGNFPPSQHGSNRTLTKRLDEWGLLRLSRITPNYADADCLRALLRIWRRRLPTIRSSPGCKVMDIICKRAGRPALC